MLEALQEIQKELGPDAIVLSMREIPAGPLWQVWNKPGVEVVATSEVPRKHTPNTNSGTSTTTELDTESPPGRKEIEALLTAIAEKKQRNSQEKLNAHPMSRTGMSSNNTEEPQTWSPPLLQNTLQNNSERVSSKPAIQALENVVRELKSEQKTLSSIKNSPESELPNSLRSIKKRLVAQGVDASLVDHILETNINTLSPAILSDEPRLIRFIKKQLEANLTPQQNSMGVIQSRVMCLVGPSGSGKTSTIAKLAAYYKRILGKNVIWICADTVRAGAISETKTYTEVLEIPLFLVYSPQELEELLKNQTEEDLILVDTPGISMVDEDRIVELGSYLSVLPGRSIFITAPATMKEADIQQGIATFNPFKIRGIIVTKLDETYTYGSIYNIAHHSRLPLLFFTNGNQILGDLHQGNPETLISYLFGEGIKS